MYFRRKIHEYPWPVRKNGVSEQRIQVVRRQETVQYDDDAFEVKKHLHNLILHGYK